MCNKEQAHDCIFNRWILCISCIANYHVIVGRFMHGFFASRIIAKYSIVIVCRLLHGFLFVYVWKSIVCRLLSMCSIALEEQGALELPAQTAVGRRQ
jgi:hypothetical protein